MDRPRKSERLRFSRAVATSHLVLKIKGGFCWEKKKQNRRKSWARTLRYQIYKKKIINGRVAQQETPFQLENFRLKRAFGNTSTAFFNFLRKRRFFRNAARFAQRRSPPFFDARRAGEVVRSLLRSPASLFAFWGWRRVSLKKKNERRVPKMASPDN